MSVDHIRYDILAQEALRSVLRRVVADAAKNGLPGDHHFYISFDTNAPGVRMSERLHAQYPDEITIVLQHQFWDLVVGEQAFEVGLSFNGAPEHLAVPFAAIKRFFDPSVQFGLQFEINVDTKAEVAATTPVTVELDKATAKPAPAGVPSTPVPADPAAAAGRPRKSAKAVEKDDPHKPAGGGEVVRLDRFRKK